MKDKKLEYVEPENYFPKSLRKKYKIGEYAKFGKSEKKKAIKKTKKNITFNL